LKNAIIDEAKTMKKIVGGTGSGHEAYTTAPPPEPDFLFAEDERPTVPRRRGQHPAPSPQRCSVLAICGDTGSRSGSRRVLALAVAATQAAGADVSVLDLHALDLPVYDPDAGTDSLHGGVMALRRIVEAHDGFLIVSTEHNGSLPAVLKNALDWSTRQLPGSDVSDPFGGKVAAIMSSTTADGGASCLDHLRSVLAYMGLLVLPAVVSVSFGDTSIPGAAQIDASTRLAVGRVAATLVGTLRLCRLGDVAA
jgi:NAD(P)H-dependent FMN reductase